MDEDENENEEGECNSAPAQIGTISLAFFLAILALAFLS